jgi:zinc transport system substrate-binding protein
MKKIVVVLLCFAVVLSVAGCFARPAVTPETSKINVYTSFYPLYDFAVKIGGDRVDVVNMIPAGIEPHDWEPSPQLLTALLKADILLFNGLGLDLWVEKTAETLQAGKVMLVNTSDGIEPLRGYKHDHDHDNECDGHDHDHEDECDGHDHNHEDECDGDGHDHEEDHDSTPDPHIWLDPLLALHQTEKILEALIAVDPVHTDYYRMNYNSFKEQIESLHKAYADGLRQVVRREFIVTHRSFGYLAHRYGLLQLGISGLSPHQEPGPGEMKGIVEFITRHNIKYIFREPLIAPRLAEVLAAETGTEILMLNPLGGLTAADMTAGRDYFTVMYENLEQLKKALLE